MNVLVINCGSSSLKASVVNTDTGKDLASCLFEKLGSETPLAKLRSLKSAVAEERVLPAGASHNEAMVALKSYLGEEQHGDMSIDAVGHRVVHGAERFTGSALLDNETLQVIESCSPLAPLHNPVNLIGINKAIEYFPGLKQVGVFDTAFHQTIDKANYLYAIPYELYETQRIRRYGFHGTSHKYVSQVAAEKLDRPLTHTSVITAHLGNGCSATAIENGCSVDTSMGLTPLEGLVMGTRSGDIDPGVIFHLHRTLGLTFDEVDALLNKKSGLLGVSQKSNDMRTLRALALSGDEFASLAIEIFVRRLAKSICGLRSSLRSMQALIFTGGIGENDAATRSETVARLEHLGLQLDEDANKEAGRSNGGLISTSDSQCKVLVIPTNEELMIARETEQTLSSQQS